MSETADQQTGVAWGDPISPQRLAELKEMFERQTAWVAAPNRDTKQSAFYGIHLTGADVFWLEALVLAETKGTLEKAAKELRIALRYSGGTISPNPAAIRLDGAYLWGAQLENAYLSGICLKGANLSEAHLKGASLSQAYLQKANLERAHLEDAHLSMACLDGANLYEACLQRANLLIAQMTDADLRSTHLEGTNLTSAWLEHADLSGASFDRTTRLYDTRFIETCLDQVIFDNVRLGDVNWGRTERLGEELAARNEQVIADKGWKYTMAARAYRSLAVALRNQGLRRDATHFHYRAELMERKSAFWYTLFLLRTRNFYEAPVSFGRWLFSWLLGTFAGYGDYFGRLLLTYLVVVSAFAGLMFLAAGRVVTFDAIRDVFVLSITSFHGRGVQPPGLTMTDVLATLTAVEAFFGLLIEGIFIAAFTRRVTGN